MQTCNGEHCLQFSVLIYPHRLSNAKFYHSYILKMESVDTKRKVDPYFSISVIVVVARQQPVQQHHSPSSCEFGLQLQKHSTFCLPSSGSGNDWTLLFLASESESSWFVLQRKCCALSKRKKMVNHWCLDNPIDHIFLVQQNCVHVYEFCPIFKNAALSRTAWAARSSAEGLKYNAVDPKYPLAAVADICTTETACWSPIEWQVLALSPLLESTLSHTWWISQLILKS